MTGSIIASLSNTHEGYLLCNGQAVLRSDYPQLYTLLGSTYGETSTHFNLPNLADRSLIGANANIMQAGGSNTIAFNNLPTTTGSGGYLSPMGAVKSLAKDSAEAATIYSSVTPSPVAFIPLHLRVNYFIKY